MSLLRSVLAGFALAAMEAALASADLISFTTTIPANATDLANAVAYLPGWDPGGYGTYDFGGSIQGPTMHSLGVSNTLIGCDITIQTTISGSFTITNSSTSSSSAGFAWLDTYTAMALGTPLTPALSMATDPADDLFRGGAGSSLNPNLGGGPDPRLPTLSFQISPNGGRATSSLASTSQAVSFTVANLGAVETSTLTLYLSSLTAALISATGGIDSANWATTVTETATVSYDYVDPPPSAPEPATMAMVGGALIVFSTLGKRQSQRLRKNRRRHKPL